MVVISGHPLRLVGAVNGPEPEDPEDLIASLGGFDAVREKVLRHEERCSLFESRRNELAAQHPNQFVAMAADDTIITSETLDGLFAEIDQRGIERETCVVEYLNAKPQT